MGRDAVVEANHVIMFVQCSLAAPIQCQLSAKKNKKGKTTTLPSALIFIVLPNYGNRSPIRTQA